MEQGKILFIYFIPLQAVGIEPGDGDLRPKEIEGGEERRVGIVALDPGVNGMVVLTAGDEKGFFILPPNRYAELGERLDGQIDVGAAFDRRNELDGAALRHQREDEKEPGDKLAADVAFDLVAAAFQPAADGDALRGGLKKESLLFADFLVDAHGSGKKGRAAGEGDPAAAQKAEGNEKAQRTTAFAAVQNRSFRNILQVGPADGYLVTLRFAVRADGGKAVESGFHILGGGDTLNDAFPFGKGAANEQPVRHAFGRGRLHDAPAGSRLYFSNHFSWLLSMSRSMASR